MIKNEKMMIFPDKTFIASKGENSDFLSKEKYNGYSLEGGTLPLTVFLCRMTKEIICLSIFSTVNSFLWTQSSCKQNTAVFCASAYTDAI